MYNPQCPDIRLIMISADIHGWNITIVSEVKIYYRDRTIQHIPTLRLCESKDHSRTSLVLCSLAGVQLLFRLLTRPLIPCRLLPLLHPPSLTCSLEDVMTRRSLWRHVLCTISFPQWAVSSRHLHRRSVSVVSRLFYRRTAFFIRNNHIL